MAITGDGRQSNPYTFDPEGLTPVEVWEHFLELIGKTQTGYSHPDTYGLLPANYVLDMNEVDTDIDFIIEIKIRYLNAQGFTIKNLRSSADYMFSFNEGICNQVVDGKNDVCNIIYDLHLENLYGKKLFTQGWGSTDYPRRCYFYGLIVSGYFTTTGSIIECALRSSGGPQDRHYYLWSSSSFTNKGCGFNVKVPNGHFIVAHGTDFEIFQDCLIDFTSKSTFGSSFWSGTGSPDGLLFNLQNSLIQGRARQLYIATSDTSVINMAIVKTTSSSDYNGALIIQNSPLTIWNSDKVAQTGYASSGIGVTDAQMKDPAYLQSVGFPILE